MKGPWSWQASDSYGFRFDSQSEACMCVCVCLLVVVCLSCVLDVIPNLRPEFAAIWLYIFYLHFRSFTNM